MLARRAANTRLTPHTLASPDAGSLSFVYCTRTILRLYSQYGAPRSQNEGGSPTRRQRRNVRGANTTTRSARLANNTSRSAEVRSRSQSRKHQIDRFGQEGYTVNESWEDKWARSLPIRRQPKGSLVNESPPQKDDNSYAPFAGWKGPASKAMALQPKKKAITHVPFEYPSNTKHDPHADLEGTTITPTEKRAFETLFKMNTARRAVAADSTNQSKSSTVARETDPSRSEGKKTHLDSRLDNILRPNKNSKATDRPSRPASEFPEPLRKLKEAANAPSSEVESSTSSNSAGLDPQPQQLPSIEVSESTASLDRPSNTTRKGGSTFYNQNAAVRYRAQRDIYRVSELMKQSTTDVDVWNILCTRVLERVIGLGLDAKPDERNNRKTRRSRKAVDTTGIDNKDVVPSVAGDAEAQNFIAEDTPSNTQLKSNPTEVEVADESPSANGVSNEVVSTHPQPQTHTQTAKDLQILSLSFPEHLKLTMRNLRKNFPGSPLSLHLIPHIKSLGPATATLGLSTYLYNLHIQQHWRKYRDPLAIDALLQEMDDNIYEFDWSTINTVVDIVRETRAARRGDMGPALKAASLMERTRDGHGRLNAWIGVMHERMQREALRRSQDRLETRRMEEEEQEHAQGEELGQLDGEYGSVVGFDEVGEEASGRSLEGEGRETQDGLDESDRIIDDFNEGEGDELRSGFAQERIPSPN